jgi:Flp pilus assembly protein TadD
VVEENPVDLQALNNLGAAYVRLGLAEEARNCFDAVVQAQPGNLAAKANLAQLKEKLAKQRSQSKENRW